MNMARGINRPAAPEPAPAADEAIDERPVAIGGDERRMQVRAYNHWVSLLRGRAYPAIHDLDPENIADFGPNSVLLDFTAGIENPAIRYLGAALREECGIDGAIAHVGEVPSRSLLSRLTDHYLQIIANRAPIGFEAEFVGQRGHQMFYRGILMPFASDAETIGFIYGVINWKEVVDADTQARLDAEIEASRRAAPHPAPTQSVWADGPSAGFDSPGAAEVSHSEIASPLADQLMMARESAAAVRASDLRGRAALYRALDRAYGFALAAEKDADGYAVLLAEAGIAAQARAPMTPVVKLVFGPDYDKTRLAEFAAVLTHARRLAIPAGGLDAFLEITPGGVKGVVQAERELRATLAGDRRPAAFARAAEALRQRPPLARVAMAAGESEFVLLLARAGEQGLDIIAKLEDDAQLTDRAVRRAAA
ncbi:PAS domain-containing protein [Sphingomonas sp.]|uniref:PAS domain-containing protein n=1 Tax=Sphingomonas sp. TaxID=28214 RepID=UPI002FD9A08A